MGIVFLADQPSLARTVAIKVPHPRVASNRAIAARFREEAVAASRVRHPRSVGILDCSLLSDGTPYLVMQYVPGRSLGRLVAEQEVPLARAVDLVVQALTALGAAHDSGVVHADVKSENFLVEQADDGDHVTMIDFGLSRWVGDMEPVADGERVVSGTPEYMAPEVVCGETPSRASDLYGVGVILYELLTGTTPFGGGSNAEVMSRQVDDVVVPPSLRQPDRDIPAAIDAVVLRALHKQPEGRFPDAGEFVRALRRALPARRLPPPRSSRCQDVSSSESPTRNFSVSPRRQCLARGSDCNRRAESFDRLRRAIGAALVGGDRRAIADGYVMLANELARDHQVAAAIRELQEGIDVLTAGRGLPAPGVAAPVDQLATALARLCNNASVSRSGDPGPA
jgi:serine/threonine-protein kinase